VKNEKKKNQLLHPYHCHCRFELVFKLNISDKLPAFTKQLFSLAKSRIIGLNSFNKTNLTFPCLKFIKNTWINKYLICGKQYFSVWMRISAVDVLLNLPAFYRKELEFPPDFLGRKGGEFYAPVRLIDTKRR
jgi:hypothetical protein